MQKSVMCAENVVLCAKKWAKKVDVCKIGKKCGVCKNVHMSVQIVWWCVQKCAQECGVRKIVQKV